jgi:pimeloyl-ACP methyl ester carboxylesterase
MQLHVEERGPATAPVIVFLHGGGVGSWMWEPVARLLPEYRCLLPDLPRHGASREVGPFSIAWSARLIASLIRERAAGAKAHLVGLSLGAQVGVALLAQTPALVERTVLSSPLLRPLPLYSLGLYRPWALALAYWTTIAPFKRCDPWIRLNMKYAVGLPADYWPDFRREFRGQTLASWTEVVSENVRFRMPAGLERADCPVLVVAGRDELPAIRGSARALSAVLPRGSAYMLAPRDSWRGVEQHNWALKAPDLFAAAVRAWLEDKPLPPELRPLPGYG